MIFKIGVLKNSTNVTGIYLFWSFFLIKLQAWRYATLLKRYSKKGVFLWNLRHFEKQFFLWNTSGGCFCIYKNFSTQLALLQDKSIFYESELNYISDDNMSLIYGRIYFVQYNVSVTNSEDIFWNKKELHLYCKNLTCY